MLEALEKTNKQDAAIEENALGLTSYEYQRIGEKVREREGGEKRKEAERRREGMTEDLWYSLMHTYLLACRRSKAKLRRPQSTRLWLA